MFRIQEEIVELIEARKDIFFATGFYFDAFVISLDILIVEEVPEWFLVGMGEIEYARCCYQLFFFIFQLFCGLDHRVS